MNMPCKWSVPLKLRAQALLVSVVSMLAVSAYAADASVEAARAARERAKAELQRAQEAFERADEAYINALGGMGRAVSATPAPAAKPSAPSRPRVVTFTLEGPRVQMINPLEYRARLIVDGQPGSWTQHASGAKTDLPAAAGEVTYEVQNDEKGDAQNPAWRTICSGAVPSSGNPTIEILLAKQTSCSTK